MNSLLSIRTSFFRILGRLTVLGAMASSVCVVQGLGSQPAWAQPSDKELREARAAFQAALALEAAGDFKNALIKFREVAAVRQTPNVTFHIAVCLEKLGRWTEALGTYRITVDSARDEGAQDVFEKADEARQSLEARVPTIQILRGEGTAGAVVELDGVRLGSPSFGVKMPADPGEHRVVATVDGKEVFSRLVVLKEGQLESVTFSVQKQKSTPIEPPAHEPKPIGPSQRAGHLFLGAGVASMVVGGMFLKLRSDTIDQLEAQCVDGHCDPGLEKTSNRGKVYAMAGNAFLGIGLISAGIGTVVLVQRAGQSEASSGPAPRATRVGVSVGGAKGPGATLWGEF